MYNCPSILIWKTFRIIMQGEETQTETGKLLKVRKKKLKTWGEQGIQKSQETVPEGRVIERNLQFWRRFILSTNQQICVRKPPKSREKLSEKIKITLLSTHTGIGIISVSTNQIRKPQYSWVIRQSAQNDFVSIVGKNQPQTDNCSSLA